MSLAASERTIIPPIFENERRSVTERLVQLNANAARTGGSGLAAGREVPVSFLSQENEAEKAQPPRTDQRVADEKVKVRNRR